MSSEGSSANYAARCGALLVLAALLLFAWSQQITGRPIEKDAAQTTLMAFNLAHHGVMSMEEAAPYVPSDYREPIPVAVSALGIRLIDAALGPADAAQYLSGRRVQLLKGQNLLWLGLLSWGAFVAARRLTGSFVLALLAVVLANLPFIGHDPAGPVNDLYTELPASAALMWASFSLVLALERGGRWIALAGVLIGVLTLVKAVALYVFAGVLVGWLVLRWWQRNAHRPVNIAGEVAVLLAAYCCIVGPWLARNRLEVGTLEISQRAGAVLMIRALHDEMTRREYVGGYYLWAPAGLRPLLGRLLGFSPRDLQRGGQLQRLNDEDADFATDDIAAERAGRPDRAISYYRQARAMRVELENRLAAEHRPDADQAADVALKQRAFAVYEAHPLRHLALTGLFLWRGSVKSCLIFACALIVALRARRQDLVAFTLPSLGLVSIYGLFSHFIPRYDLPSRAVAAVTLAVLIGMAWNRLSVRRGTPLPI